MRHDRAVKEPADAAALTAFLEALATGARRGDLHADPLMPTRWQVAQAARLDPDGFGTLYLDAQRIGLEVARDEMLDIADDSRRDTIETDHGPRQNTEWIARSKLRIDTRQWLLERLARDLYGNKSEVSVDLMQYVVELPAPITDKQEWLKQYGQSQQDALKSVSGVLNPDPKPH